MTQIKKTPEEDEWIALRNLQGVDVSVAGWTISGGIDYKLPATGGGAIKLTARSA